MRGLSWVLEGRKESALPSSSFKQQNPLTLLHQEFVANGSMCVPRCDLQCQQLFVLQTWVVWNSAIHCSVIPTDCQGFAVVNAFGCSSSWIQFFLVLIWKFKSSISLFYHTIKGLTVSELEFPALVHLKLWEVVWVDRYWKYRFCTPIFSLLVSTPVGCFPSLDQLDRNMCSWASVEGEIHILQSVCGECIAHTPLQKWMLVSAWKNCI